MGYTRRCSTIISLRYVTISREDEQEKICLALEKNSPCLHPYRKHVTMPIASSFFMQKRILGLSPNIFFTGLTSFFTDTSTKMVYSVMPLFLLSL